MILDSLFLQVYWPCINSGG